MKQLFKHLTVFVSKLFIRKQKDNFFGGKQDCHYYPLKD